MRRILAVLAATSTLAACETSNSDTTGGATNSTIPATTPPSSDPASTPSMTTGAVSSDAPATTAAHAASIEVIDTDVTGGFDQPVDLIINGGSVYVVEQSGRVRRDGEVALDVRNLITTGGERGLLGLALHPFEPLAYINYTDTNGDTAIVEYRFDDGEFSEPRMVLSIDQPYDNHNGGGLAFDEDGLLYIGMGDGGSGGDPERRASDPNSMLGSMLRIDPTGRANGQYSIPSDNPFGTEVWSFGLRNPWRFTFDRADLWIADVGQSAFEEINYSPGTSEGAGRGANYGWSAYEGTTRFNNDVAEPADHVEPVWVYGHDAGCSVSGAATFAGWFIYGDYCDGRVMGFDRNTSTVVELAGGFNNVTAIRNGAGDQLYVLEHGGTVTQLTLARR